MVFHRDYFFLARQLILLNIFVLDLFLLRVLLFFSRQTRTKMRRANHTREESTGSYHTPQPNQHISQVTAFQIFQSDFPHQAKAPLVAKDLDVSLRLVDQHMLGGNRTLLAGTNEDNPHIKASFPFLAFLESAGRNHLLKFSR